MPAMRVRQSKSVVAMAVHFDFFFALSAVNPARDTGRRLHRAGLPGAGCASLAAVAAAICRCGVALILPPQGQPLFGEFDLCVGRLFAWFHTRWGHLTFELGRGWFDRLSDLPHALSDPHRGEVC
jgi:hypothetical protein